MRALVLAWTEPVCRDLEASARGLGTQSAAWYRLGSGLLLFRGFRFDLRVTCFGAWESTPLCRQQTISYYDTSNGTEVEDAVSPFVQWLSSASKSGSFTSAACLLR